MRISLERWLCLRKEVEWAGDEVRLCNVVSHVKQATDLILFEAAGNVYENEYKKRDLWSLPLSSLSLACVKPELSWK